MIAENVKNLPRQIRGSMATSALIAICVIEFLANIVYAIMHHFGQIGLSEINQIAILLLPLVNLILLAMWLYLSNKNLPILGAFKNELRYTPGDAAASLFLPIYNITTPYKVAVEIWERSDTILVGSGDEPTNSYGESNVFILAWWIAYLCSIFILAIDNLNPLFSVCARIIALALTVRLVWRFYNLQRQRLERMRRGEITTLETLRATRG